VYHQDWRSRGMLQFFQYQALKWVLALFVGLVVGLVGFFNNIAVENIAGFKLLLTSNLVLHNRYKIALPSVMHICKLPSLLCHFPLCLTFAWGFRYISAFVVYMGCNAILAAAAAALCAYIAPAAAGSGIPEVKAYLNGIDAHSILAPSTLIIKVRSRNFQAPVLILS
jgi:chloride channel 7